MEGSNVDTIRGKSPKEGLTIVKDLTTRPNYSVKIPSLKLPGEGA